MENMDDEIRCGICDDCWKDSDYYWPDPFESEIHNDYSKVNLCDGCYDNSCMEV